MTTKLYNLKLDGGIVGLQQGKTYYKDPRFDYPFTEIAPYNDHGSRKQYGDRSYRGRHC